MRSCIFSVQKSSGAFGTSKKRIRGPETDYYDATDGAEERYPSVSLGGLCDQCEQKIYSKLVEVEKTRPLTEMEQYHKRCLARIEQVKEQ